jgi:asparagine synthase (glutamine-hydrolysing)
MCGIAGLVGWGDRATLARMNDRQAHRGPDDAGLWEARRSDGAYVGLANRRLAIQDLSPAGHMPMVDDSGSVVITYNGEIYNFPELRRELVDAGHRFRSDGDTEVILQLYLREGPSCLRRLNGMFGLAIYDGRTETLLLARDHFGVKPLYLARDGQRVAFASELKALLVVAEVDRSLDPSAIDQYLSFLWVPEPRTAFRAISKLPAGHYALLSREGFELQQYWDLPLPAAGVRFPIDEHALALELADRLEGAVRRQMISDAPIGAFLSAGLDSTSIVAIMARHSPSPPRTYTISFPPHYRMGETTLDDPAVAQRTADTLGCDHHHLVVEPRVADLLPRLVWHMDDPVSDPATVLAYLVAAEARQDVKVLLSGVGGDELFAGYRKYRAHYLARYYRRLPQLFRSGVIEPLVGNLPAIRGSPAKGYIRLAKKMVRSGSLPERERFISDGVYMDPALRNSLYGGRAMADSLEEVASRHYASFDRAEHADFLNQMMYVDQKTFMVSLNLNYNDKMTMAASVEGRVPLLDWELAEWTMANVPPSLKLKGAVTKHILREAVAPVVPAEVLTQKKAGFAAPIDYWLTNELRPLVDDLLDETTVNRRGLFDPATVRRLVVEHRAGRRDWSMQVWQLMTLELWLRAFTD